MKSTKAGPSSDAQVKQDPVKPKQKASGSKKEFDVQGFVDKKLKLAKTIEVPNAPDFPNDEADASNWSVAVVAKYLKSKLELPQYVDNLKRHEVDGLKFISLDEEQVGTALEIGNKLHCLKIAAHAQTLREYVYEKAVIERPPKVLDWAPAHFAAWLHYDKACPQAAIYALRSKLTPYKAKDSTAKDVLKSVKDIDATESQHALQAFEEIIVSANAEYAAEHKHEVNAEDADVEIHEPSSAGEGEATSGKAKKGKRSKTAIRKRREKARAEAELVEHGITDILTDDDAGNNLSEEENHSLPVAVTGNKASSSAAYSAAMASIHSGVQSSTATAPASHCSAPTAPGTRGIAELSAIPETELDSHSEEELHVTKRPLQAVKSRSADTSAHATTQAAAATTTSASSLGAMTLPVTDQHLAEGTTSGGDAYVKSAERKKFLGKIAKLRKVVAEHAEHMEDLREQAQILKEENLIIRQQQRELLLEGRESKELIATLVNDRNVALVELERVVALYDAHTGREREQAARELKLLADDTHRAHKEILDIWKRKNKELAELGSLDVTMPVGLSTVNSPDPAERTRSRRTRGGEDDSSGSDLDDPAALAAKTSKATASREPAVVLERAHQEVAGPVPTKLTSAASTAPLKEASAAAPVIAPTTTKPTATASAAAVSQAATVPSVAVVPAFPSSTGAGGAKDAPVDLVRMLDNTANAVHDLWTDILRKYRSPRSHAADAFSDSRILLRYLSLPWLKLGQQMLNDAHSTDTPKDVRKALKGLERCARKAVLAATRRAKKLLATTTSDGAPQSPSTKALPAAGNSTTLSSTAFGKKFSQSALDSTAFPTVASDEMAGTTSSGKETHVHRHHRALGMVFGLALVQRLFQRYAADNEDKTQLLFLLNKLNHGDLPVTEISRDNLRDFLESHIGIDLAWDKFDSVCQKLDPDRNGFISTSSVTQAFEQLAPLADRLPPAEAMFNELFLMSVASETLSKPKLSMNETLMSLILHNSKSSASFAKYIEKEQTRIEVEDAGYRPDPVSPRSGRHTGDARVAEQQLFVSDVLYELSKEFVYKAYAAPDLADLKLPPKSIKELEQSQLRFKRCKKALKYFTQHHQETCAAVARGLYVYEGASRKRLMGEVSKVFLVFLRFRRKCLQHLLASAPLSETHQARQVGHTDSTPGLFPEFSTLDTPISSPQKKNSAVTASSTAGTALVDTTKTGALSQHGPPESAKRLSAEQLQQALTRVELNLATLTGVYVHDHEAESGKGTFSPLKQKPKAPTTMTLPEDSTTFEEYESILSELLGIPLPHCDLHGTSTLTDHCTGLETVQYRVEEILQRSLQHFAFEESLTKLEPEPPKPLANSAALKELQQTLYQELWQGTAPDDLPDAPARRNKSASSTVLKPEPPPIHVIEEVNTLMHQQRVEQCSQYLEVLNEKAARRKKMIRNLMNLWQAAKASIIDGGKIPKFASASEIELKRLLAMPAEEIVSQTKSIQQVLVHDMQEPTGTKVEQLSQRVNLLRQGLINQTIPDEDLSIATTLREISALESALLQANSDAMRLAARIIKQLEVKKHVSSW